MSAGQQPSEQRCDGRRVFWGASGSETELGHTEDGSLVVIEQEQTVLRNDEYGIAPVKKILAGEAMRAELILSQWDPAQLLAAIPGSTAGTGTDTASVYIGRLGGIDLSGTAYAKRLRLHPLSTTDTSDETDNIYINLAIPKPAPIQARWSTRQPALIGVIFEGIVDTSAADGKVLGRIRQTT